MRKFSILLLTAVLLLAVGCTQKATGKTDTQNDISSNIEVEVG